MFNNMNDVIDYIYEVAKRNNIKFSLDFTNSISYMGRVIGKRIILSKPHINALIKLNNQEEVKELVLHELGHILAKEGSPHGNLWKQAVIKLGGNPTRVSKLNYIFYKYIYKCPKCGKIYKKAIKIRKGYGCCKQYPTLIKQFNNLQIEYY